MSTRFVFDENGIALAWYHSGHESGAVPRKVKSCGMARHRHADNKKNEKGWSLEIKKKLSRFHVHSGMGRKKSRCMSGLVNCRACSCVFMCKCVDRLTYRQADRMRLASTWYDMFTVV